MKKLLVVSILLAMSLSLVACGNDGTSSSENSQSSTGGKASSTSESVQKGVAPYAWLGLEDMPQCNYLDLLAGQHYIRTFDAYTGRYVVEGTEAVDGLNLYKKENDTVSLLLDGMEYTFSNRTMTYMTIDMTSTIESLRDARAEHVTRGINEFGRAFQGSGSGSIPLYADSSGDTASYEYYEYLVDSSPDTGTNTLTERFYMKDGDVFAIYKLATVGNKKTEITEVIKTASKDIPEGLLALPENLDEYTQQ